MQSFTINGNEYFDRSTRPVLYAEDGVIRYWNPSMASFALLHGLPLEEGAPVPSALIGLEGNGVARMTLAGVDVLAECQPMGDGTLFTLTEQQEKAALSKYETLRFCGKLRTGLGEGLLALQTLYEDMVETEQHKLEEPFRPLLQQYCRLLRMVGSTELMVQEEQELSRSWGKTAVNLSVLMDGLRREVEPMEHRVTCQSESNLLVQGNEALLRRALLNLLANGLQAGGEVSLSVTRSGDFALIEVKTLGGKAMDAQAMGGLFEEADLESLLKPGGLHFGLQVCWKIFRLHGGTLALLNQPDGLLVRGRLPLLSGQQLLGSGERQWGYAGGISDVLIELSDVLEPCWYSTGELLD